MTMTVPESHRDLLDAEVATLATTDGHGRPQLSELWFLAEDGVVRLSLNTARQKVRNLQRRPDFSLLILDRANPYRYVEIRGEAEIEPDPDYTFADRVGEKYGSDLREMDQPGESRVVVTLRADRVRTWG
jgi:PPOX class probable F420-dependent enzyme